MKKELNSKRPSGSKSEPKVMSEVLNEYFRSDEPLAVAFRKWVFECEAEKDVEEDDDEDRLFQDLFPNSELDSILKLLTRKPGRLGLGAIIRGSITRDGENHYTFVEDALKGKKGAVQRNPIVIRGTFLNLHTRQDGTLYPCLNRPRFSKDFTFQDFCRGAAGELLYFASLVEKNTVSE